MALGAAAGIRSRTGVDICAADAIAAEGEDILGGIDACNLPFDDASFDLVVSQFGIEYAGLSAALIEAARVSCGKIAVLLHAADGAVVAQASEQARQASWIDEELDGFAALERGRSDLSLVLARIDDAIGSARNSALLEAFCINAQALVAHPDRKLLAAFASEWRAHAARMRELARAAPDLGQANAATDMLRERGFLCELTELRVDGALVGRWLSGRRAGITDRK